MKKPFPVPVRVHYSCKKCPAYCCTYSEIEVTRFDIERLARHFELTYRVAEARFTWSPDALPDGGRSDFRSHHPLPLDRPPRG